MPQPVWALSVNLETKTATFQSGLAEAAKSAKGAFAEIKSGAGDMGGAVGQAAGSARQSVMLLGDEFGIHLPRGLTMFIASLGPVGAAMEVAFPFVAIALGATLLLEHLAKLRAEGIALTQDQMKFATAVQMAFNQLDARILQAEIRSDELRNDHLGALRHQLELINTQSMGELMHSFEEVAKSADVVFAELKTGWYQFGTGSTGAKHALDEFQAKYDALLAAGKDGEASDLLKGTRESAEKTLALQQKAAATKPDTGYGGDNTVSVDHYNALNALKQTGVGFTEKEVSAQKTLIDALTAQLGIEQRVAALKKIDSGNATLSTGKEMAALQAEGARAAAEHQQKMGEIALGAERESTDAILALKQASIAEKLAADIALADQELRIELAGNGARIAALDKGGKDYNNQLAALQDKGVELVAQHEATVADLTAKATAATGRESLQNMEQSEREQIEATLQGSRERLAAIDAALKEEQSKNLQATANYRDLLKQRVQALRDVTVEEAKLSAEAGKEEADNALKMGQLALAAAKQNQALMDSMRRVSTQERVAEAVAAENQEYALKVAAMQREAAALDQGAKDYQNKLKAIQNKELQMVKEHENAITAIKNTAEQDRNTKILAAESQFNNTVVAGLTQVLMGHKSFASMMNSLGNQVVSGMMENAIKSMEANLIGKESDAAKAARQAYIIGQGMGGPAGVVLGPLFAAVAFSTMTAFAGGGVVPGIGNGDIVPAMLTPGEGVIPGGTMDKLNKMASSGDMGGARSVTHAHFHNTYHLQALDDTGIDKVLKNHEDKINKHITNTLRKMNR